MNPCFNHSVNDCQECAEYALGAEHRRHSANLLRIARRLEHQGAIIRNSRADRHAGTLLDEARSIRWALQKLQPIKEQS